MGDPVATILKTNRMQEALAEFNSPEAIAHRAEVEAIIDAKGLCKCTDIEVAGPCGKCFAEGERRLMSDTRTGMRADENE